MRLLGMVLWVVLAVVVWGVSWLLYVQLATAQWQS